MQGRTTLGAAASAVRAEPESRSTDPAAAPLHGAGDAFDADVVIVGLGPVGVCAALLLGRMGISTIAVERERAIYPRARAVTVNDWTLRIFQSLGLAERLKADMLVNGALRWRTYAGKEVFRLGNRSAGIGHPASMMIYQPAMEGTLRECLADMAGTVEVHFGEKVVGLVQDSSGVSVTAADVHSGERRTLRAKYVLACDGGSSGVRAQLGIDLLGTTHETDWIVVDAEVLRWWPGCNELIFWTDADRPVVDIPLALGNHRWEFPLRSDENKADFDSPEAIWRLLTPMGVTPEHVRIKQHAFYVHHVRHAETWRVGRVLLLGDAAHMMPPWAGQGMQSGIRDAQNVTWKLREILAGRLDESLLDSYQAERAPHVEEATEMSKKLGMLIASQDRKFIRMRNALGPVIKRMPLLTNFLLPSGTPAITTGWVRGTPGKTSAVGRMIPQPMVCSAQGRELLLDDALGAGFALLGLDVDPRSRLTSEERSAWQELGARFVTIRPASGRATEDDDLIDHTGRFGAWMSGYGCTVIAVRPDRFVAADDVHGIAPPDMLPAPAPTAAGRSARSVSDPVKERTAS